MGGAASPSGGAMAWAFLRGSERLAGASGEPPCPHRSPAILHVCLELCLLLPVLGILKFVSVGMQGSNVGSLGENV